MTSLALERRWRDALLAVVLAVGAAGQLAGSSSRESVAGYVWVAATTLPLAVRRRAPVAVGLGIQLAFALGTPYVDSPDLLAQGVAAFLVATYVAALGARSWTRACACGVGSLLLLSLQGILDSQYEPLGAVVANCVYVAMTWAVAAAVRVQVDRSRRSVSWARQAVLDERTRLARELHDVLGHSISVMVLRARGGVHEHQVDPAKGLDALRDVETVGSRALADVRLLLELDHEGWGGAEGGERFSHASPPHRHPVPGLEDITALVESTRSAGLDVELRQHGAPRSLSASLGLTAYRVTQESLTNVMRHSLSRVAQVGLTWSDHHLVIEVSDDGPSAPHPGSGRGLIGMRDRIALVGGELQSGGRSDGGFTVCARIPVES
jgi:signal transduction histidine kinase